MTIVKRGKGKYAYRSVRVDGHETSRYLGSGMVANLVEQADSYRRQERESQRQTKRNIETCDRKLMDYNTVCRQLIEASLIAAGYHRHDRGPWRKRRNTHG
jgi:hypothetical protein